METPSKQSLIADLNAIFSDTVSWLESQPEENFNKEMVPGKWTMAGHLYHLIKSTKAVSKGLGMPKLVLRMTFGVNNREERTYDQQYEKYKNGLAEYVSVNGKSAQPSSDYVPEKGRTFEKVSLLKRFEEERVSFVKAFEKISEKDLGKFVVPHPLMGKMTLREITYFTIFHTKHHLDALQSNYQT